MTTQDTSNAIDYEQWAERQLNDSRRRAILKWKAVNLANLFFRTLPNEKVSSIAEVGGAEGIVLNTVGRLLAATELVNYDTSSRFCQVGRVQYPHIKFVNSPFPGSTRSLYDIIVLSDIIEHVENEERFLQDIAASCRFALVKMPIEECIMENDLLRAAMGRRKREDERYGPGHYNGHLRGYTVRQAKASIARYFSILDMQISDTLYFGSRSPKRCFLKRILGTCGAVRLFGGALFILGKSRHSSRK